ncbi:unnamed protein product, partial [Oppiella nova]
MADNTGVGTGALVLRDVSWLVNFMAHIGPAYKPYDKYINPRESRTVTYLALGEGYYNYHHTFPGDHSAFEYGWKDNWNIATAFIDMFGLNGRIFAAFGILCGAHRLWSHRSYKAKWQLRVLLAGLQTLALQNSIYEWC